MTPDRKILLLDRSEVRATLEWTPLLQATRAALIHLTAVQAPPSVATQLPVPGGYLHLKSGAVLEPPALAVKANLRPDSGGADGLIAVFDHQRQTLRAILASADITPMRTAAIAGIAAQALQLNPDAVVGLVGAGPVARYTGQVLVHLGLGKAGMRVWSRRRDRAQSLVDELPGSNLRRVCADIAEAVHGADLVVTCTPARVPLLQPGHVNDNAVVLAMGADGPGKRELADGILDSAELIADDPEEAFRVGEFVHLTPADKGDVLSLGDLLKGHSRPKRHGRRTVVDSVGSSAVDAAVSAMVLELAQARGSGTWIGF